MENCAQMQELISRMLDEDLAAVEQAELAKHLESCPECRMMYKAFASLSDAVGKELAEPPASLRENVMAQLRRERMYRANRRPWRTVLAVAAMAAVVLGVHAAAGNRLVTDLAKEAPLMASARQFEADEPQMSLYSIEEESLATDVQEDAALPAYDLSDRTRETFLRQLAEAAMPHSADDTEDGTAMKMALANGAVPAVESAKGNITPEPWRIVRLSDGDLTLYCLEDGIGYIREESGTLVQTGLNVEQFEALFDGF